MNPPDPGRRASLWQGILGLLFPRQCLVCGDLNDDGPSPGLCKRCAAQVDPLPPPWCVTCGKSLRTEPHSLRRCERCREMKPVWDRGRSAFPFTGVVRQWIHGVKYRRARYFREDISASLLQVPGLNEHFSGATLVPVPLHPKRQKLRGFNQSLLLAEWIAEQFEVDAIEPLLFRTVNTRSQTHLNLQQRETNLKGAFAINPGILPQPHQRYIIVDDVLTTGSTVQECARTLRERHTGALDIFALAHG